jgi:hypothetical protein
VLLRSRYVLLVAWTTAWFFAAYESRPKGHLTDWLTFEFGARTLVHLNSHYDTGALSLYAHYPFMQIGPPALVIVGALQWLRPATVQFLMAIVMALSGVWCLRCSEQIVGRHVSVERRRRLHTIALRAGLVLLPMWAWEAARWEHLDDVISITAILTAMAIITSGKRWWLAAILVGLAVASKPWAIAAAPVLMGMRREDRGRASLVAILTAAGCWGPFVVADSQTISALGNFQYTVDAGSTAHFLGMALGNAPRWVRPVQFIGGFLIGMGAVRQGRWVAVPLIAFAFRVVIDPQMWLYYGMGPLVAAALWDCADDRKWPIWTGVTAVVEFGVPSVEPSWSGPVRLAWFLAIAFVVLRPNRDTDQYAALATVAPDAVPEPALV